MHPMHSHPHPPVLFPFWGWRCTCRADLLETFLCFWFWRFLSWPRSLPQLFPSVSGPFLPQFGVCSLLPKALRKCVFCCLPRLSGSPEGLAHPLEGPACAALQSLQAAFMAVTLPHVLLTTGVIRSTSQERSDNGGSGATVCCSLCTSRQSACLVFILGCL